MERKIVFFRPITTNDMAKRMAPFQTFHFKVRSGNTGHRYKFALLSNGKQKTGHPDRNISQL